MAKLRCKCHSTFSKLAKCRKKEETDTLSVSLRFDVYARHSFVELLSPPVYAYRKLPSRSGRRGEGQVLYDQRLYPCLQPGFWEFGENTTQKESLARFRDCVLGQGEVGN